MYLSALEYKMAEEWNDRAVIEGISSLKYLNEYFDEPKSMYMLLINEYLYSEKIARHECVHTFLLTEDEKAPVRNNNVHTIFKYMGIPEIYGKISRYIQAWKERKRGNALRVTAVCGMAGGCGKTLLSLGIASVLAGQSENVLYLSAESLQAFHAYLGEEEYLDDGFCYSLVRREAQIAEDLRRQVKNDEFFYLPPMRRAAVSYQITADDYIFLLDALAAEGYWQEIVLELPSEINAGTMRLLDRAARVVVVCRQNYPSALRLHAFQQSVNVQEDKYLFICTRYDSAAPNELAKLADVEIAEYIEEFTQEEHTLSAIREKDILHNLIYILE